MNHPDLAGDLALAGSCGVELDPTQVSFFLSREKIVPVKSGRGMALWRDRLFAAMARNAARSARKNCARVTADTEETLFAFR